PIILDAEAINALSGIGEEGMHLFKRAKREVIITPHPLEFARVSLSDVASVQLHRLSAAKKFAAENKITVVLKGAGSIITDGSTVYINTSGSSALAKAGSGDVLAGFLAAIVAQGKNTPTVASALAVYLHAVAGQRLAGELSAYGVTPSDLPKEIARVMGSILSGKADEFDV
ncbi:MAG: NAD(P)H-hydrate dehydratase, partial [Clostridia bacterium]|nr:NAD(P)H-hydrate dehydratase [Clostridia bacterium]